MLTITAIIRVKTGTEQTMRDALLAVANNVRLNEPHTIGFFASQDGADPCVFTTYERAARRQRLQVSETSCSRSPPTAATRSSAGWTAGLLGDELNISTRIGRRQAGFTCRIAVIQRLPACRSEALDEMIGKRAANSAVVHHEFGIGTKRGALASLSSLALLAPGRHRRYSSSFSS